MTERIVITVDGHAGSGKTSLCRLLAKRLGFCHFSSGLLYRGLGMLALRAGVSRNDEAALCALLSAHRIEIIADSENRSVLLLDGVAQDEANVQAPEVSEAASLVSAFGEVRKALVRCQREAFAGRPIIAEGRDMGTVIFPDAPMKFFIEVEVETRVQRRLAQLAAAGSAASLDAATIRREIHERDERDSGREHAPTKAAGDAVVIHNDGDFETALAAMEQALRERGLI